MNNRWRRRRSWCRKVHAMFRGSKLKHFVYLFISYYIIHKSFFIINLHHTFSQFNNYFKVFFFCKYVQNIGFFCFNRQIIPVKIVFIFWGEMMNRGFFSLEERWVNTRKEFSDIIENFHIRPRIFRIFDPSHLCT